MEELLIVTTGGTIDKVYFDDKSDFQVGDPQIGRILQELGVGGVEFHRFPYSHGLTIGCRPPSYR